jgi:proteasome assembly chaperone (PAC2) family protein
VSGTGIAGAETHAAPHRAARCYVCRADMESPRVMRGMPGIGAVGACSDACARDDKFRSPMEITIDRLQAEIAAMREVV